ncbi:MurR/RpiR family transcriptional regulator [Oceanobacillus bengalensis]|uniref:MurR/RpiR family transcriptional regulator n=1 Tax=Oceanobacillus bengalensis TaxID=1435466 RepID=A0A494YZN6_9BACI|nr:MurR/RpiR family transcriptional regulator [Oceanobacillus bengalensis]RKQ15711.1 MurR/RpiR family transcriptional regulator [Oceanobacillus bengalensis]
MEKQANAVKPTLRMQQNKQSLTKSEHKIFDYIQHHKDQVIYHSLTELSDASEVAEATALRFFRKLGYKGFQDFKLSFAQEVTREAKPENEATFVEKVKDNVMQALEESYELVDLEELQKVIDVINASSDVVIFGIGASGIAALDMQNRLMRIGKNVQVVTDSHAQIMRATTSDHNTVVIAISLTGSTKDIVDSVSIAKGKNAQVVVLTNYIKSPLTKFADHVLLSSAKESPIDRGLLVSKISQLFLIDLICTGITIKNNEQAEKTKMEIIKNTASKLY